MAASFKVYAVKMNIKISKYVKPWALYIYAYTVQPW